MNEQGPVSPASRRSNAAKRLHTAMVDLKGIQGVSRTAGMELYRTGFDVLTAYVPRQTDEKARLTSPAWNVMLAIAMLTSMIDDVYREVENSPLSDENKIFYLECVPPFVEALSPQNLMMRWGDLSGKITEVALQGLSHLDRRLRDYVEEVELNSDDFLTLLDEIRTAYTALEQSTLDKTLKDFVLAQMLKIRRAVDEYRFRGAVGLQEALAGYAGAVGMAVQPLETLDPATPRSKGSEVSTTLDKLIKVVNAGNALLTLAHGTPWLIQHALPVVDEIVKSLN